MVISSSCISEFSNRQASSSRMGVSFIENSCRQNSAEYSINYYNIKNVYAQLSLRYTLALATYVPTVYSVEKPMVVSEQSIKERYEKFMSRYPDLVIEGSEVQGAVDEFSRLYFEMLRYETQKCSFSSLAKIEYKDVRKIADAQKVCQRITGDSNCQVEGPLVKNLTDDHMLEIQDVYLNLCAGKNKRRQSCLESYALSLKNSSTLKVINSWLGEISFSNEAYFKLIESSSKFLCEKDYNDHTIMNINVFSEDLNEYELRSLLDFAQKTWSRDGFEIKFEIVYKANSDTVVIKLTDKMISFVPHSNTKMIYLSKHLGKEQSRLILAHEFGHVLGFPDCYMEFYSKANKELIYYELNHEENLMCAVDSNNKIPTDYLLQLKEKSCKWD